VTILNVNGDIPQSTVLLIIGTEHLAICGDLDYLIFPFVYNLHEPIDLVMVLYVAL
jgi:hypothetical protein